MLRQPTQSFCLFLSVLLVSTQVVATTQAMPTARRQVVALPPSEAESFDELCGMIDEYRTTLPFQSWQIEHWSKRFDSDPGSMVAFVREQTGLVPYRGSLRGSQGVLMDRRGNSLDRAILLAEFLRQNENTVQLCNAKLTTEQARTLLSQTRGFDSPSLVQRQKKETAQRRAHFAASAQLAKISLAPDVQRIEAQQKHLDSAVQRSIEQANHLGKIAESKWKSDEPADKRALEALRDHWWVRYQKDGAWRDLDPTGLQRSLALQASRSIPIDNRKLADASVPRELCHRIEVRVVIEQWSEDRFQTRTALQHEWIPSQSMDQPIVLYHVPRKFPADAPLPKVEQPLAAFGESLTRQTEWIPILAIGQNPVMQKAFDDRGYLLEEAVPSVFGSLGEGLAKPSQPAGQLTAEWIEYEIRVPGQEPRLERREVFNLADADRRARSQTPEWNEDKSRQRALALTDSIEILPLTCQLDPGFVEQVMLDAILANRELLKTTLAGSGDSNASQLRKNLKSFAPLPSMAWGLGAIRSQQLNTFPEAFLGSPNLLTFHRRIKSTNNNKQLKTCLAMDIVFNQLELVPGANKRSQTRLQLGVLDTNLEAMLLRPCSKIENAAEIFAASQDQKVDWQIIESRQQLEALPFSADTKAKMQANLDSGFAIIAPDTAVDFQNQSVVTWWRVNLTTGETLGIGELGWGQAMTERTVLLSRVSKRGEGMIEYLIILSLIMVCGIVSVFRSATAFIAPASTFYDRIQKIPFCVATDSPEETAPPDVDDQ